jgi:Branched-chain amino acid transport protein (AzlD)
VADVWITIAALVVITVAIKATGPLAIGGRTPGERTFAVISLFAPALLAALIVYETLSAGHEGITIDARVPGLAAAGLALVAKAPMLAVILVAAGTTALVRAIGA